MLVTNTPLGIEKSLGSVQTPAIIANHSERTTKRYLEFLTAKIRNKGTRQVYARAALDFFDWCENFEISLEQIEPLVIATYIESITHQYAAPTVKVKLAAIRMLYDHLVTGQIVPFNPAASVRGPKHVVKKGKTPVLSAELTRELLDSIDTSKISGLRDKALIAVMVFSFARVSAAIGMNLGDYHQQGRRMWFRLHEKGGRYHEVPAHHKAEEYLDDYIQVASIGNEKDLPIFRTIGPDKRLTSNRMTRSDTLRMIKRRAKAIGLAGNICCHTWRATGITTYLQNGGTLEKAKQIAGHESSRTTQLYNRSSDELTLEEIERLRI